MLLVQTSHENRRIELYFVRNQYRLYLFENNVGLKKIVAHYEDCVYYTHSWLFGGMKLEESPSGNSL